MEMVSKRFIFSFALTVLPVLLYAFLYYYPEINYFSYSDNDFFTALWNLPWLLWFAFGASPLSILFLLIVISAYRKSQRNISDRVMLISQVGISAAYALYWLMMLRIIFMI